VPRFNFTLFKSSLGTGATPFTVASMVLDLPTMKLLLAHGPDTWIPNHDSNSPLILPASLSRADSETRVPETTAFGAVEFLLSLDQNFHAANKIGNPALHQATMADLDKIAEYLVKHGAVLNAKEKVGKTPLKLAHGYVDNALLKTRPSTAEVLTALEGIG
jgi:ankyrin repeat protein